MKYSFALTNLVARIPSQSKNPADNMPEAMPSAFCPTPNHVWCGRGNKCYEHNHAFRALVHTHLEAYSAAPSKLEKSRIVTSVFDDVTRRGGFVRRDSKSKLWHSVPEMMAREKISQAFRDCLTMQYKSSKDCRQLKRKQARTENKKVAIGLEKVPASKRLCPSRPSTTLTTGDALQQLLAFSQDIVKNTFLPSAHTQKEKRVSLVGMEIPAEMPSVPSCIRSGPGMMHQRGSFSDVSLNFGDISEEFSLTPQLSA
jgi:hypothetical protein